MEANKRMHEKICDRISRIVIDANRSKRFLSFFDMCEIVHLILVENGLVNYVKNVKLSSDTDLSHGIGYYHETREICYFEKIFPSEIEMVYQKLLKEVDIDIDFIEFFNWETMMFLSHEVFHARQQKMLDDFNIPSNHVLKRIYGFEYSFLDEEENYQIYEKNWLYFIIERDASIRGIRNLLEVMKISKEKPLKYFRYMRNLLFITIMRNYRMDNNSNLFVNSSIEKMPEITGVSGILDKTIIGEDITDFDKICNGLPISKDNFDKVIIKLFN